MDLSDLAKDAADLPARHGAADSFTIERAGFVAATASCSADAARMVLASGVSRLQPLWCSVCAAGRSKTVG